MIMTPTQDICLIRKKGHNFSFRTCKFCNKYVYVQIKEHSQTWSCFYSFIWNQNNLGVTYGIKSVGEASGQSSCHWMQPGLPIFKHMCSMLNAE